MEGQIQAPQANVGGCPPALPHVKSFLQALDQFLLFTRPTLGAATITSVSGENRFDACARAYERARTDPTAFWREAAERLTWTHTPTRILEDANTPLYRWFSDGELNTCFNAVDRHMIVDRGSQPTIGGRQEWSTCECVAGDRTGAPTEDWEVTVSDHGIRQRDH